MDSVRLYQHLNGIFMFSLLSRKNQLPNTQASLESKEEIPHIDIIKRITKPFQTVALL